MILPIANNKSLIGTAAGSVVLSNRPTALRQIIFGGTSNGTITFYDSSSVAGTAASNQILPAIGSLVATNFPYSVEVNIPCSNGLVYTASEGNSMTVTYD